MDIANIKHIVDNLWKFQIKDIYSSPELLTLIDQSVDKKFAEGGSGDLYSLKNEPNVVLKVLDTCSEKRINLAMSNRKVCEESAKNFLYKILYDKGYAYLMTNIVCEAVIGGVLYELVKKKYTLHFSPSIGIWLDPTNIRSYYFLNKLKTIQDIEKKVGRKVNTDFDFLYQLFELSHSLGVAQETGEFTHYDMHTDNILFDELTIPSVVYPIPMPDGTVKPFELASLGYQVKIVDFGMSRVKKDNILLSQIVDYFPVRNFGMFNPYYDIAAYLGSILLLGRKKRYENTTHHYLREGISDEILCKVYAFLYDRKIPKPESQEDFLKQILDDFYKSAKGFNIWRPTDESPGFVRYFPTRNVHELTLWLAQELETAKIGKFNPIITDQLVLNRLSQYTLWSRLAKRQIAPLPDIASSDREKRGNSFINRLTEKIGQGITYESMIINYLSDIPYTVFTPTSKMLESCPLTKIVVHNVFVNHNEAINMGYRYRTSCCKESVIDFMEKRIGVAMNGGFFDINRSYIPIGLYQQNYNNNYSGYKDIPLLYMKYYGIIEINKEGKQIAIINPNIENYVLNKDANIFMSGPILVWNKKIVFDYDTIKDTTEMIEGKEVYIFQCRKPEKDEVGVRYLSLREAVYFEADPSTSSCIRRAEKVKPGKYLFNSDMILPGELAHASNPNPRSMLIIRENTDGKGDLVFSVIEGRDSNGSDGADMYTMAKLALQEGAITAINLDGGMSSTVVLHRAINDPLFSINQDKLQGYPVGNILSMIRE